MDAARSPALLAALSAVIAVTCFSLNDAAIKLLSGGYALHLVVLIRSVIGLVVIVTLILPFAGGLGALRTRRLGLHMARGLCVVFANMAFFLGLSVLPLAEAVAIFFISPLVITIFSVIFLGEYVGPRRWAAVGIGLVGVVVILRPGSEAFQPASLLPALAALGYAGLHILTRISGRTESAATMAIYIQCVFIAVSLAFGIAVGHGAFYAGGGGALDFLLRPWSPPPAEDWPLFVAIGFGVAFGGFFISQAYRLGEAALVAPFEYAALPLSVLLGYVVFGEILDAVAMAGIALILGSGLYMIWREARAAPERR